MKNKDRDFFRGEFPDDKEVKKKSSKLKKEHLKNPDAVILGKLAAAKRRAISSAISELLAIMHRDGGHHQEKVGTLQAIKDAQELLHKKWIIKEDEKT